MRQSLNDEKSARDEIAQKLTSTDATLVAREQSLTQLRAERNRIADERNAVATTLTETQRTAADLAKKFGVATQEATLTKEQLAQLQRELAEQLAEASRTKNELAKREQELEKTRTEKERMTALYFVVETEKKNLQEKTMTLETQAKALETQVEAERSQRIKVQETTTQLAQGVGQLAEKSVDLAREIRDHRPINANVLFSDFGANGVTAAFAGTRKGFLGQANRTKETNTVLVTDGRQVYALLHISDTVFALGETGLDWESLAVELSRKGTARNAAGTVSFLAHDPRIVAIPLDATQAAALGAKIYPLAAEPFKFPEAVLIDGGGRGYGEVGFKLDPTEPGFVRVDNRLFKRMFGDFAPKRGDLVFAKTGELLGIMVNNDYCALLKNFAAQKSIQAGADIRSQSTGALFDELIARVRAMPLKLQ